jgi:hypothetical protein
VRPLVLLLAMLWLFVLLPLVLLLAIALDAVYTPCFTVVCSCVSGVRVWRACLGQRARESESERENAKMRKCMREGGRKREKEGTFMYACMGTFMYACMGLTDATCICVRRGRKGERDRERVLA